MEFLRRQQQASVSYARRALRDLLDAADGSNDGVLTTAKDGTRELLKQGRAIEDSLPDGVASADPIDILRRQYRAAIYEVRRIARELLEASDAKDSARILAAKEAARELLRPGRLPQKARP